MNTDPIAGSGFSTSTTIDGSKECVKDCIDEGNYFCRRFFDTKEGVCCAAEDAQCRSQDYDLCSNEFTRKGM